MKLTDNEIRDITRFLEAGKPLPEKYRFLLFEDKREVELVWNGKTSEVCNIVLLIRFTERKNGRDAVPANRVIVVSVNALSSNDDKGSTVMRQSGCL